MVDYRIENGLIILTLEGIYPVNELLGLTRSALDDPAVKLPALILVDASRSKTVRNAAEVEKVARAVSEWRDRIDRIALFVSSHVHYHLIRMGVAISNFSSFDVAPFLSYDEALAFLEQP